MEGNINDNRCRLINRIANLTPEQLDKIILLLRQELFFQSYQDRPVQQLK